MESFSKKVKDQLHAEEIRKKCCRFTDASLSALSDDENNGENLREIWSKCRCDTCRIVFLRRLFILHGSVTDPTKSFHLDYSFRFQEESAALVAILNDMGLDFRTTERKGRQILYLKDSTAIEDFLVSIGAQNAAFDVMNTKIMNEFRNSVNRQVNCDTANIKKQLATSQKYIEAIRYLMETGKLETLPEELRNTAKLRMEHNQLSLSDLAKLTSPPVTKSGMKHRLEKILSYADETRGTEKQTD